MLIMNKIDNKLILDKRHLNMKVLQYHIPMKVTWTTIVYVMYEPWDDVIRRIKVLESYVILIITQV